MGSSPQIKIMRKKILVLTSRYPFPVIGGDKLRIYQVCKELSKEYELTLLSLCDSKSDYYSESPDNDVFSTIEKVYLPKWRSYLNTFCSLFTRRPLQIAYYSSSAFRSKLDLLIKHHDVCLAHLIRTGEYLRSYRGIPKVLEMTDSISLNYERVSDLNERKSILQRIYQIESKRLAEYERTVLKDFDSVSLVSSKDRNHLLRGADNPKVIISSNGVQFEKYPFTAVDSRTKSNKHVIVFIGNMTTVPNLDACYFFARKVLPELNVHRPVTFRIIGKMSKSEKDRFTSISHVEVFSNVENVTDYVHDASLAVCPMRLGAGVQNKLLEYMALGIPAITTTIGLEGVDANINEHVLLANTAQEFIEKSMQLIDNKSMASFISENAREFVEREHSWEKKLSPLMKVFREQLEQAEFAGKINQEPFKLDSFTFN